MGIIEIGFKPPAIISPIDGSVIRLLNGQKAQIAFSWDTFDPNAEYTILIQDQNRKENILEKTVKGGSYKYEVGPGLFRWYLKSTLPEGITLDGKDPNPISFKVIGKKLERPEFEKIKKINPKIIKWKRVKNSNEFQVQLERLAASGKKERGVSELISSEVTTSTSKELPVNLPEGRYKFSAQAVSAFYEPSEYRSIVFDILPSKSIKTDANILANAKPIAATSINVPLDFIQLSIGPVIWNYSFASTLGQKFELVSGTITAIDGDITKWFSKTPTSSWGAEFRGRQTNIYLFEGEASRASGQNEVMVTDRRLAVLTRRRTSIDKFGIDAILGVGRHQYTYLVQDQLKSTIHSVNGQLLEIYVGGALDWQFASNKHLSFDLTFHPVGTSIGISAEKTWQYTATLRFIRQAIHERSFFTLNLENFRSRLNTRSDRFTGSAETISTWLRLGAGIGIKI
jgi:hypothetical protein